MGLIGFKTAFLSISIYNYLYSFNNTYVLRNDLAGWILSQVRTHEQESAEASRKAAQRTDPDAFSNGDATDHLVEYLDCPPVFEFWHENVSLALAAGLECAVLSDMTAALGMWSLRQTNRYRARI